VPTLLGSVDEIAALDGLRTLEINYDPSLAPEDGRPDGHWHLDSGDTVVGREPPGEPVPGGPWELACLLVREYEFTEPRILRAVYRPDCALLGRDMVLEGRFFGLRFYLGVRVTRVIDETRDAADGPERVWGWSYQTLQGHLEQGRLSYEVIKDLRTGTVSFRVAGYSRAAVISNPVIRFGFLAFGRWTQRRFYAAIQRRMTRLVAAAQRGAVLAEPAVRAGDVVVAPARVRPHPLERLARAWLHPAAGEPASAARC
jgi:uncharacterized protein (UPF0548 family)